MKKGNMAYLAGIIDGEGSIRIEKQVREGRPIYYRLRLSISNTNLALMQWLQENFSGSSLKEKMRIGNRKQIYQWEIKSPKQVGRIVRLVYPYLIIKRGQAEVALEIAEIMVGSGRRYPEKYRVYLHQCWERMRALNKKGFTELRLTSESE